MLYLFLKHSCNWRASVKGNGLREAKSNERPGMRERGMVNFVGNVCLNFSHLYFYFVLISSFIFVNNKMRTGFFSKKKENKKEKMP